MKVSSIRSYIARQRRCTSRIARRNLVWYCACIFSLFMFYFMAYSFGHCSCGGEDAEQTVTPEVAGGSGDVKIGYSSSFVAPKMSLQSAALSLAPKSSSKGSNKVKMLATDIMCALETFFGHTERREDQGLQLKQLLR